MKGDGNSIFAVGGAWFECVAALGRGAFGDVFSVQEVRTVFVGGVPTAVGSDSAPGDGGDLVGNDEDPDRCGDQETPHDHFEDAQQERRPLLQANDGALSLRFVRPALSCSSAMSRPRSARTIPRREVLPPRRGGTEGEDCELSSGNTSTETRGQRELQRILADGGDTEQTWDSLSSFTPPASFSEHGSLFALKLVQIRSEHQIHSLAEEIRILHALRGAKHVVQLLAAELDIRRYKGVMLLELAACDLRQVLEIQKKKRRAVRAGGGMGMGDPGHPPDLPLIGGIFLQACLAVQSVHARGILHFDLKPENFLCFEQGGEGEEEPDTMKTNGIIIKLADFGVSAQMTTCQTHITRETPVGSIKYMAPETISQQHGATYDTEASIERSWVRPDGGYYWAISCFCAAGAAPVW